jgi:release factor glutamine methyltransferase
MFIFKNNKHKITPPVKRKAKISLSEILSEISLEKKETEILAAFLLNKTRESILSHPEIQVSPIFCKQIKSLEKKRLANFPLAYLTGQKEFYGLGFRVNRNVLVPRPETELMVEYILDILKQRINELRNSEAESSDDDTLPLIIDVGTGSGAIIISLASELRNFSINNFNNYQFIASDISPDAINIAKDNAKKHQLNTNIKFYRGDLLKPISKLLTNKDLIIAANLPYLTPSQVKGSLSISREPKLALVAGQDGLKYYREIFKQLQKIKYKSLIIFCEIDPSQAKSISILAKDIISGAKLEIIPDLSGRDRFLKLTN